MAIRHSYSYEHGLFSMVPSKSERFLSTRNPLHTTLHVLSVTKAMQKYSRAEKAQRTQRRADLFAAKRYPVTVMQRWSPPFVRLFVFSFRLQAIARTTEAWLRL